MRAVANTASDTRHLNPGSNQLNADTSTLPGTSGGNSSQQHLELIELHSNPDNMDMSHNYVETICFDDEISEELYEVDAISALPFYDCGNNDISDVINPVNSIMDDLKQTKHKFMNNYEQTIEISRLIVSRSKFISVNGTRNITCTPGSYKDWITESDENTRADQGARRIPEGTKRCHDKGHECRRWLAKTEAKIWTKGQWWKRMWTRTLWFWCYKTR